MLKPGTPAEAAFPYLDKVDMVLVMTVEPGFGGQSFMADMMPKAEKLRAEIDRRRLPVLIEADGGITEKNASVVSAAGIDVVVSGTGVFKAADPAAAIKLIQNA